MSPSHNAINYKIESSHEALMALKIAFSYMSKAIEVTKYKYGDRYQVVLNHIETVREMLLINDVVPDEVSGDTRSRQHAEF